MSSAAPNPRRRAARPSDPDVTPSLIDSFQNMSIRKGDTFHPNTNTSKSSFWDPLESSSSSMTVTRSTTAPQALEDLLIGAGERQVANLLTRVDKAIAAQSKVALSNVLSEPEVLPVPTFMVDGSNAEQKTRTRHHSHSSDSGLGSSVADSTDSHESSSTSTAKKSTHTGKHARQSFKNYTDSREATGGKKKQSMSSISNASDEERGLSKYAADQIHKHIVQPILAEESLKEFHGLVKSVPSRIGDKEIKNLRELEKTLIFLAPVSQRIRCDSDRAFTHGCFGVKDFSRSPSKYLRFCERTIRVLHTTVTTLHESDQRAPTDRPYTQGYFFELVEQVRSGFLTPRGAVKLINIVVQIRRYATILAATRAKQAKGEKLGPMDVAE